MPKASRSQTSMRAQSQKIVGDLTAHIQSRVFPKHRMH